MITIAQIIVSIIVIILVLLQERSSGLSGVFGGGGGNASYQTRRGLEKGIFWGTVVFAVIFIALTLIKIITG